MFHSLLQLKETSVRGRNGFNSADAKIAIFKRFKSKEGVKLGDVRVSTTCSGLFKASKTILVNDGDLPQDKFIIKEFKGSFPVEVAYAGINADTYLMSLDNDTLHGESPLTVLGICTYSSVFTSLQEGDSTSTPFQSARTYPDYTSMKVRAASPVPVHVHVVKNFSKPKDVVRVLNQNEYTILAKSMEFKADKPVMSPRTKLYPRVKSFEEEEKLKRQNEEIKRQYVVSVSEDELR